MIELFNMGGSLFMGILTIIFGGVILVAGILFMPKFENNRTLYITIIKELGLLGLIVGLFGQFLGLYDMFKALEQMGAISPALLMGGLKVSSISTLYGFFIAVIAFVIALISNGITAKDAD